MFKILGDYPVLKDHFFMVRRSLYWCYFLNSTQTFDATAISFLLLPLLFSPCLSYPTTATTIADLPSNACWLSWSPPPIAFRVPLDLFFTSPLPLLFLSHACHHHLPWFFRCYFFDPSCMYNSLVGAPYMDNRIEQSGGIFNLRECRFLNEEWFLFFMDYLLIEGVYLSYPCCITSLEGVCWNSGHMRACAMHCPHLSLFRFHQQITSGVPKLHSTT